MRTLHIILILSLGLLSLGNRGCVTTDTVVLPEGPRAAELVKTLREQNAGLLTQVKAEQVARELEQLQASLAAADFETILFAATHLSPGLPRNAIEEEAKLGKARSPAPNPAEIIKGKDRVIAILQNDVATAQAAYGQAFNEAAQAKAVIATKDQEIAKRDTEIGTRDARINKLTIEAQTERDKHAGDVKKKLGEKDDEIQRLKHEYETKERATWVLWARVLSLAFIAVGALAMIVFKVIPEGAGLVGAGLLIALLTMFVDWLVSQAWWPWLCGFVLLGALGAGITAIYRMWKAHTLHAKVTSALQDLKDESQTLGTDAWEKVSDHLKYRLGDKDSFWGKAQTSKVAALGLVNPKAEKIAEENKDPK